MHIEFDEWRNTKNEFNFRYCLYLLPINNLIFVDTENGFLFTKINRGVFKDSGNVLKKKGWQMLLYFLKINLQGKIKDLLCDLNKETEIDKEGLVYLYITWHCVI